MDAIKINSKGVVVVAGSAVEAAAHDEGGEQ